jgi:hypothetical protein
MPHPMHFHGHEFQVAFSGAVRDTVLVTPGRRAAVAWQSQLVGATATYSTRRGHVDNDQVRDARRAASLHLGFLGTRLFRCESPRLCVLEKVGFPWILSSESKLINGL